MPRRDVYCFLCLVVLAIVCASCSPAGYIAGGVAGVAGLPNSRIDVLNDRQFHCPGLRPVANGENAPLLGFVEFDDFGWYRDRDQPRALLDELQSLTVKQNTVVVVYVHGWRHTTADGDSDMIHFAETLRFLAAEIESDTFRTARAMLTGAPEARVVGIAVGWRGKVWPEVGTALTQPVFRCSWTGPGWNPIRLPFYALFALDLPVYASTFGRKRVASVVGHGDLQGFVGSLSELHAARWERLEKQEDAPMMTLIMVGHSYGGHALFDAVRGRIEENLRSAIVGDVSESSQGISERVVPVGPRLEKRSKLRKPELPPPMRSRRRVSGMGDMVVLINPAIEAASYKDIDAMVHATAFPPRQPPIMVTMSSKNDGARNTAFKWFRFFTQAGHRSLTPDQSHMEVLALGAYDRQHTNSLDLSPASDEVKRHARLDVHASAVVPSTGVIEMPRPELIRVLESIRSRDLSTAFYSNNLQMSPAPGAVAHSPALVVNTSSDIVDGHSDFFRQDFLHWLSRFVLEAQLKRIAYVPRVRSVLKSEASPDSTLEE